MSRVFVLCRCIIKQTYIFNDTYHIRYFFFYHIDIVACGISPFRFVAIRINNVHVFDRLIWTLDRYVYICFVDTFINNMCIFFKVMYVFIPCFSSMYCIDMIPFFRLYSRFCLTDR